VGAVGQGLDNLKDLRSLDPSVRFNALLRLEELGLTAAEYGEFEALLKLETDGNIRFQMEKLLASARAGRVRGGSGVAELLGMIGAAERDEMRLALMLEAVRGADAAEVAAALRGAGWRGFSVKLLPSVLKFFRKHGGKEDSQEIAALCDHDDMRVLSAAIEALERLNPELLKRYLVALLVNPHLGIRARAVRLISRWDLPEALRHFESLLFSASKEERSVALFQGFFFDFTKISGLMLRFLSLETDADLLKQAGVLFMTNPDKQIPVKLMEIRQACTGVKQRLVDGILRGVLQTLYQAQLVAVAPEQMLEALEKHFKEKQIKLFVQHYSAGLNAAEAEERLKSAIRLFEALKAGVPGVLELLQAYSEREVVPEVRQRVALLLKSVEGGARVEARVETRGFAELSEVERLGFLSELDRDGYFKVIKPLLSDASQFSVAELVLVIGAIREQQDKEASGFVQRYLQTEEPELLVAAIGCLNVLNPDALHILLPSLISHRFDEVKIEAIRVFAQSDKAQALSLLEKTLLSVRPLTRRNAIFCLGQFDFSSVGKILLNAIKREADPENLEQILTVVRSNSDEEAFYFCYLESKNRVSGKADIFEGLYLYLVEQLSSATGVAKAEYLAMAEARYVAERDSQKKQSAYRLEKIQKIQKKGQQEEPFWDEGLVRFTIFAYLAGGFIAAIIWFGFMR
jgi:HEAT repeat protein